VADCRRIVGVALAGALDAGHCYRESKGFWARARKEKNKGCCDWRKRLADVQPKGIIYGLRPKG